MGLPGAWRLSAADVVAQLIAVVSPQGRTADTQGIGYVLGADSGSDRLADETADLLVSGRSRGPQVSKRSRLHTSLIAVAAAV
jgi:hypothetical protein